MYINGETVLEKDAKISPFDHGFLYGMGLFETFRVYDGHPFLLDDHLRRLNHGLEQLSIRRSFSREEINIIIQSLLQANQIKNAYVRLNVSAGIGEIGLRTEPYLEPNVMVFMKPMTTVKGTLVKNAEWLSLRRNTPEGAVRYKSHHYMNNMLAKREIGDNPDVEGLFLTNEGYIAEGVVSNIFWAINQTLFTPSVKTGILDGVTRRFVLALAEKLQLKVEIGLFAQEVINEADEMFVTNSIQEIVPIQSLDDKVFQGTDGKLFKKLQQEYRIYVEKERPVWSREELLEKGRSHEHID